MDSPVREVRPRSNTHTSPPGLRFSWGKTDPRKEHEAELELQKKKYKELEELLAADRKKFSQERETWHTLVTSSQQVKENLSVANTQLQSRVTEVEIALMHTQNELQQMQEVFNEERVAMTLRFQAEASEIEQEMAVVQKKQGLFAQLVDELQQNTTSRSHLTLESKEITKHVQQLQSKLTALAESTAGSPPPRILSSNATPGSNRSSIELTARRRSSLGNSPQAAGTSLSPTLSLLSANASPRTRRNKYCQTQPQQTLTDIFGPLSEVFAISTSFKSMPTPAYISYSPNTKLAYDSLARSSSTPVRPDSQQGKQIGRSIGRTAVSSPSSERQPQQLALHELSNKFVTTTTLVDSIINMAATVLKPVDGIRTDCVDEEDNAPCLLTVVDQRQAQAVSTHMTATITQQLTIFNGVWMGKMNTILEFRKRDAEQRLGVNSKSKAPSKGSSNMRMRASSATPIIAPIIGNALQSTSSMVASLQWYVDNKVEVPEYLCIDYLEDNVAELSTIFDIVQHCKIVGSTADFHSQTLDTIYGSLLQYAELHTAFFVHHAVIACKNNTLCETPAATGIGMCMSYIQETVNKWFSIAAALCGSVAPVTELETNKQSMRSSSSSTTSNASGNISMTTNNDQKAVGSGNSPPSGTNTLMERKGSGSRKSTRLSTPPHRIIAPTLDTGSNNNYNPLREHIVTLLTTFLKSMWTSLQYICSNAQSLSSLLCGQQQPTAITYDRLNTVTPAQVPICENLCILSHNMLFVAHSFAALQQSVHSGLDQLKAVIDISACEDITHMCDNWEKQIKHCRNTILQGSLQLTSYHLKAFLCDYCGLLYDRETDTALLPKQKNPVNTLCRSGTDRKPRSASAKEPSFAESWSPECRQALKGIIVEDALGSSSSVDAAAQQWELSRSFDSFSSVGGGTSSRHGTPPHRQGLGSSSTSASSGNDTPTKRNKPKIRAATAASPFSFPVTVTPTHSSRNRRRSPTRTRRSQSLEARVKANSIKEGGRPMDLVYYQLSHYVQQTIDLLTGVGGWPAATVYKIEYEHLLEQCIHILLPEVESSGSLYLSLQHVERLVLVMEKLQEEFCTKQPSLSQLLHFISADFAELAEAYTTMDSKNLFKEIQSGLQNNTSEPARSVTPMPTHTSPHSNSGNAVLPMSPSSDTDSILLLSLNSTEDITSLAQQLNDPNSPTRRASVGAPSPTLAGGQLFCTSANYMRILKRRALVTSDPVASVYLQRLKGVLRENKTFDDSAWETPRVPIVQK